MSLIIDCALLVFFLTPNGAAMSKWQRRRPHGGAIQGGLSWHAGGAEEDGTSGQDLCQADGTGCQVGSILHDWLSSILPDEYETWRLAGI
jgi:hypothetical protein